VSSKWGGVKTIEGGLKFPPPASPGFPLTAQLICRKDQNGKAWLDVLDPEQLSRLRRMLTTFNDQWWSDIPFLKADILSEFPPYSGQNKRGPKPKYSPERIRAFVFEKMDYHGEFDPTDSEWRHEADLVEALTEEFGMAESTAKDKLKEPLGQWRAAKGFTGR
jgi:hypothetical protein